MQREEKREVGCGAVMWAEAQLAGCRVPSGIRT